MTGVTFVTGRTVCRCPVLRFGHPRLGHDLTSELPSGVCLCVNHEVWSSPFREQPLSRHKGSKGTVREQTLDLTIKGVYSTLFLTVSRVRSGIPD